MKNNLFLKIINRELPAEIIYETDFIIVIKDINPQAPIHFLIIPKKKFETISHISLDDFIYIDQMFLAAQYISKTVVNANQYKLIINNGEKAGQCIFHLHMHFLSGY